MYLCHCIQQLRMTSFVDSDLLLTTLQIYLQQEMKQQIFAMRTFLLVYQVLKGNKIHGKPVTIIPVHQLAHTLKWPHTIQNQCAPLAWGMAQGRPLHWAWILGIAFFICIILAINIKLLNMCQQMKFHFKANK